MKKSLLFCIAAATTLLAACSSQDDASMGMTDETPEGLELTYEEKEQMKVLEAIFEKYDFKRDPAVPYETFARNWIERSPDSAYKLLSTLDSFKRNLGEPLKFES